MCSPISYDQWAWLEDTLTESEHRKLDWKRAQRNHVFLWIMQHGNIFGIRNSTILYWTVHINCFPDLENVGRTISQISPNRRLEFNVGAELAFLPTPSDPSQEKFNFSSSIESKPIPHSQLSLIVSSYEQTIGNCFL